MKSKENKALSIAISNNKDGEILKFSDYGIVLDTGFEIIAGSTRLKAATAQKICLNIMSSMIMTKLGFVKNGLMTNLVPANEKLVKRKKQILTLISKEKMNQNNETFLAEYLKDLQKTVLQLKQRYTYSDVKKIIATAKSKGNIIIVGNGGSASIASHVSVDFLKSVGIRACTFNESSLITCFANDYGYENWVKEALKKEMLLKMTL